MNVAKKFSSLSMTILTVCAMHGAGCATTANQRQTLSSPAAYKATTTVAQEQSTGAALGGGKSIVTQDSTVSAQNEQLRRQEEELERQRRELEELQNSPRNTYSQQQQEQMQEDHRLFDERGEDFARPY